MLASSEALWLLTTDIPSGICARSFGYTFAAIKVLKK
jgi:hypothetical protein